MTTDPTPCDASHYHRGGVNCELPMGHAGLHRHGEFDAPVVYWSTPFDLATRAELVAEMAAIAALREPNPFARYNPGVIEDDDFQPSFESRLTVPAFAALDARRALVFETLYGANLLASAADTRARLRAERALDDEAPNVLIRRRRRPRRNPVVKFATKPKKRARK